MCGGGKLPAHTTVPDKCAPFRCAGLGKKRVSMGKKKLKKVIICVDTCEISLPKCVFCMELGQILWQTIVLEVRTRS